MYALTCVTHMYDWGLKQRDEQIRTNSLLVHVPTIKFACACSTQLVRYTPSKGNIGDYIQRATFSSIVWIRNSHITPSPVSYNYRNMYMQCTQYECFDYILNVWTLCSPYVEYTHRLQTHRDSYIHNVFKYIFDYILQGHCLFVPPCN